MRARRPKHAKAGRPRDYPGAFSLRVAFGTDADLVADNEITYSCETWDEVVFLLNRLSATCDVRRWRVDRQNGEHEAHGEGPGLLDPAAQ